MYLDITFKNFYYQNVLKEDQYWANVRNKNSVTGWFTKTGKWIPVTSFHDHPKYIYELEPELEPNYNPKKAPKEKNYIPDDFPDQEAKKDICIARGAIRVAQADLGEGPDISIQANSLYALKGAISKLYKLFPEEMMTNPVYGDVVNQEGRVLSSFELDDQDKLQKIRF
jgi:hypothetical protein